MSMLEDIAKYIESNGLGSTTKDLFIAREPETPDDCITLYEYAGLPRDLQAELTTPGLQVRTRGTTWRKAREKLQAIQELLDAVGDEYRDTAPGGVEINGALYAAIQSTQSGITDLGEDENRRQRLTQSFYVTKLGG